MKEILPRILFMALWFADTLVTVLFVSLLGVEAEANPVMRSLIENYGLIAFVLVKLGVLAFWFTVASHIKWWLNSILCIIMTPVVIMGILTLFLA